MSSNREPSPLHLIQLLMERTLMTTLQVLAGRKHFFFLPQDMIRFSFPYRHADKNEWVRVNGSWEYAVTAGRILDSKSGEMRTLLPSGKIARLVFLWICTQAKVTNNRTVTLKPTMNALLQEIGIPWSQKNALEVSNQLQALVNCSLQITRMDSIDSTRRHVEYRKFLLSTESQLWFLNGDVDHKQPSQITLSEELYEQLSTAVPLDRSACLQLIKTSKSPLALDIYFWLCLRLYSHSHSSRISWRQVHEQFGSQAELKRFKITFRQGLAKALEVYPEARILEYGADERGNGFKGFILHPSPDPRRQLAS